MRPKLKLRNKYDKLPLHKALLMGYGAFSIWAIIKPSRFGLPPVLDSAMGAASHRASKELRKIFHAKGLNKWKAREANRGLDVVSISRRRSDPHDDLNPKNLLTDF